MSIESPCSRVLLALALAIPFAASPLTAAAGLPSEAELRSWIVEFKGAPRGPFERIRWFCKDGSVMPPKAYACKGHGGGIQHGELNQRAKTLRGGGYAVANVLADVDPKAFVGSGADLFTLEQILIERFLIGWDDGWIFRGARSYRGAFQIEDEEAGSKRLVNAMLGDRAWRKPDRFLLLRETVRLLPLQADEGSAADVRRQALVLADKDKAFTPLRAKIHNQPDAGDAAKVRAYAKTKGKAALRSQYEGLAADIDALYKGGNSGRLALALAPKVKSVSGLSKSLDELGAKLRSERDPATRVAIAGRLMALIRKHLPGIESPAVATQALQLSLALEADGYVAGSQALGGISSESEKRRMELLDQTAEALYGAGLISIDQLGDVKKKRKSKDVGGLSKPPEWASRTLTATFGKAMKHLEPLEPKAREYPQDRLQLSLVPFYRGVVATLGR